MRVYYGKYRDTSNAESDEFLHLNSSGATVLKGAGRDDVFRVCRPEGRVDYYIVMIGKCDADAVVNGVTYQLKENDCIIYFPGDNQDYSLKFGGDTFKTCAYWVHFCGTAVPELMKKAGFERSCVVRSVSADAIRNFDAVIRANRNGDEMGMLANLMKVVAAVSPKSGKKESESVRLVRAEASFISKNRTEDIDFDECAARCNLSRSRFTHVFTELYGLSPYRYMLSLRLEQATDLLLYSTLSIGEVAVQCGFSDSLYFSRLFSKNFGISPSRYRELA